MTWFSRFLDAVVEFFGASGAADCTSKVQPEDSAPDQQDARQERSDLEYAILRAYFHF